MTVETLLEKSTGPKAEVVPIDALIVLAGDPAATGEDVRKAFVAQAEMRQAAAAAIRTAAHEADRTLLASEQRRVDGFKREIDQVLDLSRHVEQRTAASYRVPESQTGAVETSTVEPVSAVLTREQPMAKWLQQRGGFAYQGERGVESLRLGRIVRALALGNRAGLTGLEQRVLAEGSDSGGGYSVSEPLAAAFLDRVRNAMVVQRAGAQIVPMTSDVLNIARVGQPDSVSPTITTATWKAENALIDETDITLERVQFVARTLPVLLKLSVELSEDSVNIDSIIETELAAQLALELDRAALLGSGSAPEPRGVRNQSGVGVTSFSGTPTDYDFLIDAIGRVWTQNHEPNARIYNASLATTIAKFKSSADSQPLRVPDVVAAVPAFRTNQIPNAGTSPDSTTLFVGDFSQLLIGLRTSFRLEVSRVASDAFERLQIAVRAYLRADIQVAHPEAFDITTTVGV